MRENFSTACRFIGALVFSLAIISVPITATALVMNYGFNVLGANIPFLVGTFFEVVALTVILFRITSTNDNKTAKPKKRGE